MPPETNLDDVVDALARQRRRYALFHLRDEEIVELEDLARQVAAWQSGGSTDSVPREDVERLVMEFEHNDLQVLRRARCIEYDDRSGVVRYRDPPGVLAELLAVVSEVEHPERG